MADREKDFIVQIIYSAAIVFWILEIPMLKIKKKKNIVLKAIEQSFWFKKFFLIDLVTFYTHTFNSRYDSLNKEIFYSKKFY